VSRERLLALDLGTTGVRALVVGCDGAVCGRSYRSLATSHSQPGRVEQDPSEMWRSSLVVLREALAESGGSAHDVAGLGVVTQRATVLAWDARSGEPLCPAIGWQDQRSEEIAAAHRANGIPITAMASATKYEWLLRHEPDVQRAAAEGRLRFGNPDAWLSDRLSAGTSFVTDPGQASCTGLYDLRPGAWSQAALDLFGVDAVMLPEIRATSEVVGETPSDLLGAPIPVAARAGDQQAACFAQGVDQPGDGKLTLGTAAMLDVHSGREPATEVDGAFALALWRLAGAADAFCLEGQVITAGAVVDWLVSIGILGEPSDLDATPVRAASSEGVFFVPSLEGLGTPFNAPARGFIGGLTRGTTSAQIARAALEGVAHRCVDVCDALRMGDGPMRVDGGLARSEQLIQCIADLAGRRIVRAAEVETTALGAAQLAGLAVKVFADRAACLATTPEPRFFEPRMGSDERERRRGRWRRVLSRVL